MDSIPNETLRIIDANLNRTGEGLRVLEELARLALDDAALTQQLKDMRHSMVQCGWPLQQLLIQARDAESDVGVDMEVPGEANQRDVPALIVAVSAKENYLAPLLPPSKSEADQFVIYYRKLHF